MRSYVFTNTERKILTEYMKSSKKKKHRHFNVLSYLIRHNERKILEDVRLLKQVVNTPPSSPARASSSSSSSSTNTTRRKRR
ncbi:MAG TPA: hypothetical protein VFF30_18455 [Nitrososphaerales archaeon]|nr:hypothetical protein [Nitrososphaerales archaeon]